MYLFSKVATSSSVVLGLTGLAVFLSPLGWGDNSQLLSSIYKEAASKLDSLNLNLLKSTEEEEISKILKPLFEQFKSALEISKTKGTEERETLKSLFDKVKELETQLSKLYEKNKDNFEKLGIASDSLSDFYKNKLSLEADLSALRNVESYLTQFNKNVVSWTDAFSQLVSELSKQSPQTSGGAQKQVLKLIKH